MEPRDLDYQGMAALRAEVLDKRSHPKHRSYCQRWILPDDGNFLPMPENLTLEGLRALLTIDGGETVHITEFF